jgi:hypothetical protein
MSQFGRDDTPVPEEDVGRIVLRAAQIDLASRDAVTISDLAKIGRDVGISEAAMHRAAREVLGSPEPFWGWKSIAKKAVVGAVLGAVAAIFSTPNGPEVDYGAIVGLAALVVGSISLAVTEARWDFQRQLAGLWAGFIGANMVLTTFQSPEDVGVTLASFWMVAALVGGLINYGSHRNQEQRNTAADTHGIEDEFNNA